MIMYHFGMCADGLDAANLFFPDRRLFFGAFFYQSLSLVVGFSSMMICRGSEIIFSGFPPLFCWGV